jgi:ribonuclease P protein component
MEMLKKDNRIESPVLFQKTLRQGEKKDNQYFKIIFCKNNQSISRFAVIVSTKVNRLAVKRNFLKRRVKNILREIISVLPRGFDVLIFMKKTCLNIDFNEMQNQLKEFLIKTLKN